MHCQMWRALRNLDWSSPQNRPYMVSTEHVQILVLVLKTERRERGRELQLSLTTSSFMHGIWICFAMLIAIASAFYADVTNAVRAIPDSEVTLRTTEILGRHACANSDSKNSFMLLSSPLAGNYSATGALIKVRGNASVGYNVTVMGGFLRDVFINGQGQLNHHYHFTRGAYFVGPLYAPQRTDASQISICYDVGAPPVRPVVSVRILHRIVCLDVTYLLSQTKRNMEDQEGHHHPHGHDQHLQHESPAVQPRSPQTEATQIVDIANKVDNVKAIESSVRRFLPPLKFISLKLLKLQLAESQ